LVPLFLRGVRFAFSFSSNSFFSALITACSAQNCSGVRNCHPLSFGLLINDLPSRCTPADSTIHCVCVQCFPFSSPSSFLCSLSAHVIDVIDVIDGKIGNWERNNTTESSWVSCGLLKSK